MFRVRYRVFSDLLRLATETQGELTPEVDIRRVKVVSTASELQLPERPQTERLSKRMSASGVCSRRQAERLIAAGLVKVDNTRVTSNLAVSSDSNITLASNPDQPSTTVPLPERTRLWLFYKPCGLITSHADPLGRPSVFDYLRRTHREFQEKHVISVGRLDYMSEGLLLLTNNGDLSQALERSGMPRKYRVRVYGRWTDAVIEKIRSGVTIAGVHYQPMSVQLDRRQSSNTWFQTILHQGKNREIRRIFEHFNLRVNRLIRTHYGPYALNSLRPGDLTEGEIPPSVHQAVFSLFKHVAGTGTR